MVRGIIEFNGGHDTGIRAQNQEVSGQLADPIEPTLSWDSAFVVASQYSAEAALVILMIRRDCSAAECRSNSARPQIASGEDRKNASVSSL